MQTEPRVVAHGGASDSLYGPGMTVGTDKYVFWHQERGTTVYRTSHSTGRTDSLSLEHAARVGPVLGCGRLGVHTNAGLTWIDVESWDVIGETPTASPHTGTLVDDSFAYIPGIDGGLQAYSLSSDKRDWTTQVDRLVSGLSSSNETVFVVDANSSGGQIVAVERSSGETRWQTDVVGETYTDPVVGPHVFVRDNAGTLHALRKDTGKQVWSEPTNTTDIYTVPACRDETVFVPDHSTGTITALDAATGEQSWRTQIPTGEERDDPSTTLSAPVCTPDSVIVGASPGGLVALDRETGAVRWQDSTYSLDSNLVATGDSVYALSTDGVVEASQQS